MLIAGHGRLRAAKQLGLREVPTITLAGPSEVQKKALRLADNKIALNAGWDLEILQLEMAEIGSLESSSTCRSPALPQVEIDVILKATNDPDGELIPAVPMEPRTADYGDRPIDPDVAVPVEPGALCEGRDPGLEQALALVSGE